LVSRWIEWVRVCWNVVATVPRMGLVFACDAGYTSSHHATPNRSFRITSPKQWVFCAIYPLLFFFYGVAWGGCNRDGCSGTLMLLSSRLIVGMVWYSFPRALGVKFPVWITDNGVGEQFQPVGGGFQSGISCSMRLYSRLFRFFKRT